MAVKRQVKELRGYRSLRALNAFNALVLGLKMLPRYMDQDYEPFLKNIQELPEADQRTFLVEAARFVELQKDEVEALISFCTDKNGIAYGPNNMSSLGPDEIVDCIVAVCMELAKIRIDLVTEDEKKN